MAEGAAATRLPFTFSASGGVGKLVLVDLPVRPVAVERLELEVTDLGTDPGVTPAEKFQRRRTRLRGLVVKMTTAALEDRVDKVRKHLASLGLTQLQAKIGDGFVSVRARAADGLAAADLSMRIQFVNSGANLRALATNIRVHGHLPTPGPIIADRVLTALFGATDLAMVTERPHTRGLCDVEVDLVGALLWHLMPPSGWRLPAVTGIELTAVRLGRTGIEIAYGPAGTRTSELGVRPQMQAIAAAHDLMHSVDQQLRDGHLEEAMRGYRALLASNGPDQPLLLERILALASARPAWFFDGLELSRQALGRWPEFQAAHAALASITLAQGDAREAASHMTQVAQLASAEGDDDQAALAALAGARLLRVLEPKAATQLYQLALDHDAGSAEAADSLADRLADEQRWSELVRLVRARAAVTTDTTRVVQLCLRLADVFVHQLNDPPSAQLELARARQLAPNDPAIHEMTATLLSTTDPSAAVEAWREVARLAETRGDNRTSGRAWATLGELVASGARPGNSDFPAEPGNSDFPAGPGNSDFPAGGADTVGITADIAWQRALELDPINTDALVGLARASAQKSDHAAAAKYYERLRGLGLPQSLAARYELELARSLVVLARARGPDSARTIDDARASLRRATLTGGETAAEAHAVLAEIAEAAADREHAASELDTAIEGFVELAHEAEEERFFTRAAELAILRATLFDRNNQPSLASQDWQRAHALATEHAPQLARDAAKTMLDRSGDDANTERRWIDAVLATRPPPHERAALLVRRADVRRRERTPDLAAALADLHEALQLTEGAEASAHPGEDVLDARRRAYQLEAELLAQSGDQRARAQALAALARMAERSAERVEVETAAAAAWLAADEPAAALPHSARAVASLEGSSDTGPTSVPAALRREVLGTLGEAAWRQRAWPDVIRAYKGLLEDPGPEIAKIGMFRYRLAVAADRSSDQKLAASTLAPLLEDNDLALALAPDLRTQALRLFADLAERGGDLPGAARALESFASLAVDSSTTARTDAMYRAGELFRRAELSDDAIRCLEAALRISDTHLPALDALEQAWRERGDLERVAVILGRKVAATARHPGRQKPLISRLGDLQAQLGRPDVALATHRRALEIDPTWRPSLRYVTLQLEESGDVIAAAGGFAQLAGELAGDQHGVDLANVMRDRQHAAAALAALVLSIDEAQLAAVREVALPALERAALDAARTESPLDVVASLARLRGEVAPPPPPEKTDEEHTPRGRMEKPQTAALSLRDAANRARAQGKLDEAFATLETANHVNPGDATLLRELVELAQQLDDHAAAAKHLAELAELLAGTQRANALLELSGLYFDYIDDPAKGRDAMRAAAEAFGSGVRHDATLRLLATEAASNLAWDVAVEAMLGVAVEKRTAADITMLANAYVRAGRDADAIMLVDEATKSGRFDDGGALAEHLRAEIDRKAWLVRTLEARAGSASPADAAELRGEAAELREQISEFDDAPPRTKTDKGLGEKRHPGKTLPPPVREIPSHMPPSASRTPTPQTVARINLVKRPVSQSDAVPEAEMGFESVSDPKVKSGPTAAPSVIIEGSDSEKQLAVDAAAASADRDRLLAARRDEPDDPAILLALLAHLGQRTADEDLRREVLEETAKTAKGRALAIALHELGIYARGNGEADRASALWARAYEIDPDYPPVWMPLADAFAASDDLAAARDLYERVAASNVYDAARRRFARERAEALDRDDTVVSGEIAPPGYADLAKARQLAEAGELRAAAAAAELAAEKAPETDFTALELLEMLYLEIGDITAASEAIGRQLVSVEDPVQKATLWRRRARIYRSAIGRDAEAYRCLKEAHACNPADPEISYLLRTAAMVRNEWALAASLLYREIAAAQHPRERGALHLELALIYLERLDDAAQAQVNFEQALAFDPTIPAAKPPLAMRYDALGRHADAARLFDEAAKEARPADRARLIAAAQRAKQAALSGAHFPDLSHRIDQAEVSGDLDTAIGLAHELWEREPGNTRAFRVLANIQRTAGNLAALTELTSQRTRATTVVADRAAAWIDVARLAEELGHLDQAAKAYDLALVEDPQHAGALDARGDLAFRLGDWAAADTLYKDIAAVGESILGPDELELRRSIIAEHLGRDTEALDRAQIAQAVSPARPDIVMRVQALATRMGELDLAIVAARKVLELIPLDDEEAQLSTHFQLVGLLREAGKLEAAIGQLERVRRDHPMHAPALEMLAELHTVRGDWTTATRYLYQLVPLAPTPSLRADRLYRLGEAVLVHLHDVDRADDVFLRASDLDPNHLPTLRRLIDVYWRADDPGSLVEVAAELASRDALVKGSAHGVTLAHALIAAALLGDTTLAERLGHVLGDEAPQHVASALAELADREGRLQLSAVSTAIIELGRRGLLDVQKVRAHAAGTAVANVLI